MKIYSSTALKNSISFPENGIGVSDIDWWFIYKLETKEIVASPQQCGGCIFSPYVVVVADTLEECTAYIEEHELV